MLSRNFINSQAEILREKTGETTAPINLENIAQKVGATILYKDLEKSVSGFLLIKEDKKTIVVNSNHHINRQRFTIAHELGHYTLHANKSEELFLDKEQVYNRDISSASGMNPQEVEANRFAAALLIPEELLRKALREEGNFLEDYEGENDSLGQLSRKFSVSKQALSNRISSLFINIPK